MQILLANAKIMFGKTDRKPVSAPLFQTVPTPWLRRWQGWTWRIWPGSLIAARR